VPPIRTFEGRRIAECGKRWLRLPILALSILSLFSPGSAASAQENAPASGAIVTSPANTAPQHDRVQAIEAHYRDLVDLLATVTQKNFLKSVDKTQTFEGTLSIKKPGKLRLEYTNGQVIVVDGKEAWFYSKQNSQAIRRTFKDFEQANIPVAFLLGAGAIRQDFDVSAPEGGAEGVLDLAPKKAGAAMLKLRLHTTEAGRISRMIVFDRSGNQSDIRFSEVRENVGIDDKRFRFKVPKGTEILEQ
jgi:outer membrane lipoprotein carrier protein